MSSEGSDSQATGDKERPAALVVCSYLGWPITGGVAAAIRQLIYFLHSIGLAIYCTAFKVTDDDQNEFRDFDVNLIYPDPPDLYRLEEESISWLHNHDTFFPEINKVERVKMVFGFSMVTSFPASAIRNKTFPDASFYLVNPYRLDTPLNILGYNKAWFEAWKKSLAETTKEAKAVFSIGSEIFNHFDSYYDSLEMAVNHLSLMLTPDNELFKTKRRCKDPASGNFHILTFLDAHDISELSSASTLAKAMNHVAESFYNMRREPPKWTIVSIPKGCEGVIESSLDPHPHLQIIYRSLDASEVITLLKQSHLLLVPPSSTNSVNLSISTIATGTPLLLPLFSPSHKAIMGYLPEADPDDIVVDMKGSHTILGDKIIGVIKCYPAYHKRAAAMRDDMELKVNDVSKQTKMMLENVICKHGDLKLTNPIEEAAVGQEKQKQGGHLEEHRVKSSGQSKPVDDGNSQETTDDASRQHSLEGDVQSSTSYSSLSNVESQASLGEESKGSCSSSLQTESGAKEHEPKHNEASNGANNGTGSSTSNSSTGDENHSDNDGENKYQHQPGHMGVKMRVSGGVPENNKQMADIEEDLFSHESTDTNAWQFMNGLASIHPDISGEGVEKGCLNFIMRCGSNEAADALWNAYSRGRLDRMADKTFLSIPLLDDIGARMLSLETFVDYQEYLQCKEEIAHRDISSQMSSEGAESPEELCDVELVRIMNMEDEKQAKEHHISVQRKQINVKTETKDKLQSTVFRNSQTFSESEKSCMDEWVTLKRRLQQSSDKLVLQEDGEKLKQQTKMLTYDALSMKYITKGKVEELEEVKSSHDRIMKGIVPKDTVRRLSREGKGPGEVWNPQGLTINHNGQVVVSDNGDRDQPGSVKTVTADTAQIISTITFHGLPNIFRPTDVKMSKNNLYYIADDGNKCILVCDAKSRLKQIIDIGEVSYPMICLGPDNTVFVTDWNGRVIKYSKAGEMISSKQLSKPYDLTMNSKYQLIVSCDDEHCIYVLDSNLNTLHTFGHEHLVRPYGVSVDAIGENIYVADENKVKIFSAQGEYLTDVTVDGKPEFIAVFADGRIVYTDVSDYTVRVIYT